MRKFGMLLLVVILFLNSFTAIGAEVKIEKFEDVDMPVLMYHMFSNSPDLWSNGTVVSPEKFKKDLLDLKEMGYTTVLPIDIKNHKEGKVALPKNPILITIDDGYQDNYDLAFPVLKETNSKATIFVIGWSRGKDARPDGTKINPHFSWEQAREMSQSGLVSIQPHTFDLHTDLGTSKGVQKRLGESDKFYTLRLMSDLKKITTAIKTNVGEDSLIFSYPYGVSTDISESLIKASGFIGSVTVVPGVANTGETFLMDRYNVDMNTNLKTLLNK
jgi:peptidoglycan/xylan/chitin deacetylase (PgdA/CDA1 family)